jgi:small subunit ribosomal protein S4
VNNVPLRGNGKRVNIPSFLVRDGDTVEIKEKSRNMPIIVASLDSKERDFPEYLEVNPKTFGGKFLRAPKLMDVPYPIQMEPNLVVEFYSR